MRSPGGVEHKPGKDGCKWKVQEKPRETDNLRHPICRAQPQAQPGAFQSRNLRQTPRRNRLCEKIHKFNLPALWSVIRLLTRSQNPAEFDPGPYAENRRNQL